MPYTTISHMPRVRRDAARPFFKGWSARKIGRYLGYHHTAVMKWVAKAREVGDVPITRLGKPNDNAHIERFNRTLQEECLDKVPNDIRKINCALKKYLRYYNNKRIHLSLNTTPSQVVPKVLRGLR